MSGWQSYLIADDIDEIPKALDHQKANGAQWLVIDDETIQALAEHKAIVIPFISAGDFSLSVIIGSRQVYKDATGIELE